MDALILDGRSHEATDRFCQLARAGHATPDLALHALNTTVPYLHVLAHENVLESGEFRNANHDHTMLGFRAGMRPSPWPSDVEKKIGVVQGMYYLLQGLNVRSQLKFYFPGQYARAQEERAEEDMGYYLNCYFEDQEPVVEDFHDVRFEACSVPWSKGTIPPVIVIPSALPPNRIGPTTAEYPAVRLDHRPTSV